MILMFICSKLLSSILFLGKIWSKNLKLSKLTETWYWDTLLYAYYDFNIYFYKIFVTCDLFFWPHNLDLFKLTEGYITIYLLQF